MILPVMNEERLGDIVQFYAAREAYDAGCELVTAQASFGSLSQNNMECAGMRIAWTRSAFIQSNKM